MTDESQGQGDNPYGAMDKKAVDAFDTWHKFHEELLKLGEFSTWLAEQDNQIDLVTFFVLDSENLPNYKHGLEHQMQFLDGLRDMLQATLASLEEYEKKQSD